MADSLLPYFNQELTAIRHLAAEFAQAHPKIAGRLRLSPDTVDDPHVARLLDGVAFLSARAQARLDDEFPELTDTLLDILYPHYLAPFPSCAIAQLSAKPDLAAQVDIPPGFELETESVRGQSCRYRTTSHLNLWPVKLESARLTGLPFTAPANPLAGGAVAVLRLVFTTLNPEVKFSQLGMDRLRLFLRGGPAASLQLYELMAAHTMGVALADTPNDTAPVLLPKTAIQEVGFAPEEALLPWPARSFEGFRLLSEYFAFPQKFMFLDIAGLGAKTLVQESNRLEIFLYLNRTSSELERTVDADMFALGCTPIVNLFSQRCEPVNLDHTTTEYRVLPDARRSSVMEVWSVTKATEVRQDSTTSPFHPFYRLSRTDAPAATQGGSYLVTRRDGPRQSRRHGLFRLPVRYRVRPGGEAGQRALRGGSVPQPRPALRAAFRRWASGLEGVAAPYRHRQHRLRHPAHPHAAAGAPGARRLAADLASLARASLRHRRGGGCGGAEGNSAPL